MISFINKIMPMRKLHMILHMILEIIIIGRHFMEEQIEFSLNYAMIFAVLVLNLEYN